MLKALLWRVEGPSLQRILQHNSSWLPGGPSNGAASTEGGRIIAPGRVSSSTGGFGGGGGGGGGQWHKAETELPEHTLLRRKEVRPKHRQQIRPLRGRNSDV